MKKFFYKGDNTMGVKVAFLDFVERVNGDPAGIEGVEAVYQFDLRGDNYQIEIGDNKVTFHEGAPKESVCTLSLSEKNLMRLLKGDLNPTSAFMTGRLKIKGNMSMAMRLQSIVEKYK